MSWPLTVNGIPDVRTPDPIAPHLATLAYPALPVGINLDPAQWAGAGNWLDSYVRHASLISPATPNLFHENAALTLISMIVARRLNVQMSHARIYPNLFSLWLALTTLWNKSTALNIARQI